MLNILLITPKGRKEYKSSVRPPFIMAIATLVSITPKKHHIELVDELYGDELDYNGNYDLVGITVRTVTAKRAYEIGDKFLLAGKNVVLGGVHPKFNVDEALEHCSSVVCGEAENLWGTLLSDVEQGCLKPCYDSKDFPPVTTIPPINYERVFNFSKRKMVSSRQFVPLYATRGCPYSCSFCVTPNFSGRNHRVLSSESLKNQIEQAKRFWFKKSFFEKKPLFMLTDENIGVSKKKTLEILETIKECNIRFSVFISINFLEDMKVVKLLVEAGCVMACVGFESIKKETIETYKKDSQNNVEKFAEIVAQCRKAGLCIQGNFINDPTSDTYEDIMEVKRFVCANHITMPVINLLTPYPGTEIYKKHKEKGLIVDYDWDKYSSLSVVVKVQNYNQYDYQIEFLKSYSKMYSWGTIMRRMWNNPGKIIHLITGLAWRSAIRDRMNSALKEKQLANIDTGES
jgi:bacteriochlorophyll C8 methyltransferase